MSLPHAPLPTASRWLSSSTLLLFVLLTLTACDTSPTLVDQHFGQAVQRAQAQQSLLSQGMPPGTGHGKPPCMHQGMGMGGPAMHCDRHHAIPDTDGASALFAVTRYQQSFQTPPAPAPVFNIGLGAVSAP